MNFIIIISLIYLQILLPDRIMSENCQDVNKDSINVVFSDSLFTNYIKLFEKVVNNEFLNEEYPLKKIQDGIKYISLITGIESEAPRLTMMGRTHVTEDDIKKWKLWYEINFYKKCNNDSTHKAIEKK